MNAQYGVSLAGAGLSIQNSFVRSADYSQGYEVTLPPGTGGQLITRTDDNTGVVALQAGHGLVTSDVVDVYWNGGVRYGMTATLAGDDATLDGGAGDALPPQDSTVVVTKQVTINTPIDGNAVQILGLGLECPQDPAATAHVDMQDSGPATVGEFDLVTGQPLVYDVAGGVANPIAGNAIVSSKATNGSSTAAATLKIIVLADSTP